MILCDTCAKPVGLSDRAFTEGGGALCPACRPKPPVLFLVLTCTDAAQHEAPEFRGPFVDEDARTLAAARAYVEFYDGNPDPDHWNESGDGPWSLYAWRLDAAEAGLALAEGRACVTTEEATAALVKAGVVPVDDAGNPIYPDTGDADEGEHDA